MANFSSIRNEVYDSVSRSQYYRDNLAGLTAYQRHQKLLAELARGDPSLQQQLPDGTLAANTNTVTDEDILRQHHRFLRGPGDDEGEAGSSWGARLARRYYDRLFKEFAIVDLSRYKDSKIGMRWRTKAEVVSGKGQFVCCAKGCDECSGLASYEVNFAYSEAGQLKQALVKLRLCSSCAQKLNYNREKQYKKLGTAGFEQEGEKQQQQQHDRPWSRGRHHKHKRAGSGFEDDTQPRQQQHEHDGAGSSKRQRISRDKQHSDSRHHEQQQQHATVDGQSSRHDKDSSRGRGHQSEEGFTDADINSWLNAMFSTKTLS